jgi:Zn-dependent protease/CBS domain-containing protein
MKWSWKIARIAGIDVNIHSTFLLLVAWVAISFYMDGRSVSAALAGTAFLLALFISVLLHEFGHALTARRYGIKTRDITLLPIGGLARLERMPDKPLEEFWVALAGPVVNMFIAGILFIVLTLTHTFQPITSLTLTNGNFLERLMIANIYLLLFNLIPAFPMDGGRVVRALLAARLEFTRATHIAALLGQGIALVLAFIGLFGNFMLLFIAFFVWIGASQEASLVQVKSALSGIPVSRAMLTDFHVVEPTDTLARPTALLLAGSQHDFPVVADGRVVGILTRQALVRALAQYGENMLVSHVMQKEFAVIDSVQMLDAVAPQVQNTRQNIIPVIHNLELVGLITLENLGEFLMVQQALSLRKKTV